MLEVCADSTTPENRRVFPDAGSVTVMVLIDRTVSMGGGGGSLQAINAETRTTRESILNRCEEYNLSMILVLSVLIGDFMGQPLCGNDVK
jgi:hypothetical protein